MSKVSAFQCDKCGSFITDDVFVTRFRLDMSGYTGVGSYFSDQCPNCAGPVGPEFKATKRRAKRKPQEDASG